MTRVSFPRRVARYDQFRDVGATALRPMRHVRRTHGRRCVLANHAAHHGDIFSAKISSAPIRESSEAANRDRRMGWKSSGLLGNADVALYRAKLAERGLDKGSDDCPEPLLCPYSDI